MLLELNEHQVSFCDTVYGLDSQTTYMLIRRAIFWSIGMHICIKQPIIVGIHAVSDIQPREFCINWHEHDD